VKTTRIYNDLQREVVGVKGRERERGGIAYMVEKESVQRVCQQVNDKQIK